MAENDIQPPTFESRALAPRPSGAHALYAGDGFADNPYASDAPTVTRASSPMSLASLLRYKWTMIITALAVAGGGLAGVWTLVAPKFRASAVIEVHPTKQVVAFNTDDNGAVPFYQQFLYTQCRKLTSPKVIERVLEREDVKRSAWLFGESTTLIDRLLGPSSAGARLTDGLDISAEHGSTLISVSVDAPDPHDAAMAANAIVEEYLLAATEEQQRRETGLAREREAREEALLEKIRLLELEAEEISKNLKVLTPGELVTAQRNRLDDLYAKMDELTLELDNLKSSLAALVADNPDADGSGGGDASAPANIAYEEDPTWANINEKLQAAIFDLDIADDTFGESHPKVVKLTKEIVVMTERLRSREAFLDQRGPLSPAIAGGAGSGAMALMSPEYLRRRIEAKEAEIANLAKLIERRSESFDDTFGGAGALAKKLKEIDYNRELYEQVKRRSDTQEIEKFAPASIEKESVATAPTFPNSDPRKKLSLAALLAAIAAGIAAAWGRAMLNVTVQAPSELTGGMSPAPFLGVLPLLRNPEAPRPLEATIQGECIRMVRTALMQRLSHEDHNVVQITSASAAAGKTTFALMLARSLAQCGKRVLLVDADLRNPTLARRLGVKTDSPGLIDSLISEGADAHTIMPSNVERLSVLPAGRPANPSEAEMLANGRLVQCLNRWRAQYDFVLLDSPPLLPVADARIMARHADGTILLAREGHSRREDVVESLACLSAVGAELLGTVMIGTRSSSRYGGGYYSYTHEE